MLAANRVERSTGGHASEPSLLAGLIHDAAGERMTPTHANKQGRRYRYYVSQSLITPEPGRTSGGGQRVPAGGVESLVQERVIAFLQDEAALFSALEPITREVNGRRAVVRQASDLAGRWSQLEPSMRRTLLRCLVSRIDVGQTAITLAVRPAAVPLVNGPAFDPARLHLRPGQEHEPVLTLTIPARLKRTGIEARLLIAGESGWRDEPDRSLLRLIARSHRFQSLLMRGEGRSMAELAGEAGVSASYFTRILKLSFLAPELVQAILSGRHPLALTAKRLSLDTALPNAWSDQKVLLGSV